METKDKKITDILTTDNYLMLTQVWSSLGEMIHVLRRRKGWSQEELAKKAGVSASYISKLERNDADPSLDTLGTVVGALGYSICYSLIESPVQTPAEQVIEETMAAAGKEMAPA